MSSRRLSGSGEEEGWSPKRPTRTKNAHTHRISPRKHNRYRDSDSPRSGHNSDCESTSHIMPFYNRSSSESEDDDAPYAGAKFNSPPPAHLLPIPPPSWIIATGSPGSPVEQVVTLSAMSSHLRQMLKVPVWYLIISDELLGFPFLRIYIFSRRYCGNSLDHCSVT